jgi:hypothetical protein
MMMDRFVPSRRRTGDPRFPVQVPAIIEPGASDGSSHAGRITDLSRGGLSLRLGEPLPSGTPVRVTLRLQRRAALTWLGRVAWIEPPDQSGEWTAGVSFTADLDGETVADIAVEEFSLP